MKKSPFVDLSKVQKKVLIDADSLCYASAYKETVEKCFISIQERLQEIRQACNSSDLELWVEDWENKEIFRKNLAVTKEYKGNRSGKTKPEFLLEAKKYLVEHHGALKTSRFESEDMCLIRATELGSENCIIAYIDKDLLQAPFTFYNYQKKEFITLTQKEAEINLYRQVLTGDITDNIPGVYLIGKAKAKKLVNEKTENIPLAVAKVFKENKYTYDYLKEQFQLIYLLRNKEEADVCPLPVTQEEFNNIVCKQK